MKITLEKLEEAILFAVKKHKGQVRKNDGRPYILHPFSVMQHLYNSKESDNIYLLGIASLLHDLVEDCNVSLEKIAKKFGMKVASLVEELTSDKELIKVMGKTRYLSEKMTSMSSYALVIKLCDRLDNLTDIDKMSDEFREKYTKQTKDILNYIKEHRKKLTDTHNKLINKIEIYI